MLSRFHLIIFATLPSCLMLPLFLLFRFAAFFQFSGFLAYIYRVAVYRSLLISRLLPFYHFRATLYLRFS